MSRLKTFASKKAERTIFEQRDKLQAFVATNIQQNLKLNYIKFALITELTEKISY